MPRSGVSYDEVAAACDAIVARGDRPTVRQVRAELGDTGSISTLTEHKRAWEEHRREQQSAVVEQLPAQLSNSLLLFAEQRVQETRESLQAQIEDAEDRASTVNAAAEKLEVELQAAQIKAAELEKSLAAMTTRAELAEQAATKAEAEVKRLAEVAQEAKVALVRAEDRVADAQSTKASLVTENSELRERCVSLQSAARKEEQRAIVAETRAERIPILESDLTTTKQRLEETRVELQATQKALAKLESSAPLLEQSARRSDKENDDLKRQIRVLQEGR